MLCSACNKGTLLPVKIDNGGPACYQCNECGGTLLSISPYMEWVRAQRASAGEVAQAEAGLFDGDATDSKRALPCPKCNRLMLRFNVLADKAHGLDFCFHCDEVWLDRGEWQYLKAQGLHTRITAVPTDPYQRKLREQAMRDSALQRFRTAVGEEAFGEVQRFATWLKDQPARDAILRHLTGEMRG